MAGLFQSPAAVQEAVNRQQLADAVAIGQQTGAPGGGVLGLMAGKLLGGLFGGGATDPRVQQAQQLEQVKQSVASKLGPGGFSSNNPEALNVLSGALADAGFLDQAIEVQGMAVDQGLKASQTGKAYAEGQLAEVKAEAELFGSPADLMTTLSKNVLKEQQLRAAGNIEAADKIRDQLAADRTVSRKLIDLIFNQGLGGTGGVPGGGIPALDFENLPE